MGAKKAKDENDAGENKTWTMRKQNEKSRWKQGEAEWKQGESKRRKQRSSQEEISPTGVHVGWLALSQSAGCEELAREFDEDRR